jgi:hypothetical protein
MSNGSQSSISPDQFIPIWKRLLIAIILFVVVIAVGETAFGATCTATGINSQNSGQFLTIIHIALIIIVVCVACFIFVWIKKSPKAQNNQSEIPENIFEFIISLPPIAIIFIALSCCAVVILTSRGQPAGMGKTNNSSVVNVGPYHCAVIIPTPTSPPTETPNPTETLTPPIEVTSPSTTAAIYFASTASLPTPVNQVEIKENIVSTGWYKPDSLQCTSGSDGPTSTLPPLRQPPAPNSTGHAVLVSRDKNWLLIQFSDPGQVFGIGFHMYSQCGLWILTSAIKGSDDRVATNLYNAEKIGIP